MRTTIDRAGRVVVPKALREHLGLQPGPVEITVDGAALRIEPVTDDAVVERGSRLVIPASGTGIDAETVDALRRVDQR